MASSVWERVQGLGFRCDFTTPSHVLRCPSVCLSPSSLWLPRPEASALLILFLTRIEIQVVVDPAPRLIDIQPKITFASPDHFPVLCSSDLVSFRIGNRMFALPKCSLLLTPRANDYSVPRPISACKDFRSLDLQLSYEQRLLLPNPPFAFSCRLMQSLYRHHA